ncbi:MAG: peptidoglycan-binding domain-containing protein [Pseudomonadota bacterium]
MNTTAKTGLVAALALSLMVQPVVMPTPAEAGFKDLGKKFKRKVRKFKKNKRLQRKILKGAVIVGGAVVAGKVIGGKGGFSPAAAIIVGGALAAAPHAFQRDMAHRYRGDYGWAGCVSCGRKKIVVAPGRKASKQKKAQVSQAVKDDVITIQSALQALGLYKIKIDGDYGRGTKKAVRTFQAGLGEKQTGVLTARQRAALFYEAGKKGYIREGYEQPGAVAGTVVPQVATAAVVPAVLTTQQQSVEEPAEEPFVRAIGDFRLASSQLARFTKSHLKSGELSSVVDTKLKPDGMIELTTEVLGQSGSKKVTKLVGVENIYFEPHAVSDQWVRVVVQEPGSDNRQTINTVDSFETAEEAHAWMMKSEKQIAMLAKLTERDLNGRAPAGAPSNEQKASPVPTLVTAEKNDEPAKTPASRIAKTAEASAAGSSAREDTAKAAAKTVDKELETDVVKATQTTRAIAQQQTPKEDQAVASAVQTPAPPVQRASLSVEESLANSDAGSQSCNNEVFVQLRFPDGHDPINHYNITPPQDTLMMDNGDTTMHVAGACVQGEYSYKYVYVQSGKTAKSWKPHVRTGTFRLASNSEQCEVSLYDPKESAQVICF